MLRTLRSFDPGVMANLFQGKIWPAAMRAVSKALNAGKGLPPSVLSKVANALMEADPNTARALLEAGRSSAATSAGRKSSANTILNALGASTVARCFITLPGRLPRSRLFERRPPYSPGCSQWEASKDPLSIRMASKTPTTPTMGTASSSQL